LAANLRVLSKWGYAFNKKTILSVVQDFIKTNNLKTPFQDGRPGDDWFVSFMKRNNLKQKSPQLLEYKRRANTADPFLIYEFYDLLEDMVNELGLQDKPLHIYNLDETGFSADPKRVTGVVSTGETCHRTIQGMGKENTTVLACVLAAGDVLQPLIIFQGNGMWTNWGTHCAAELLYAY